jgi:hypothetical protein
VIGTGARGLRFVAVRPSDLDEWRIQRGGRPADDGGAPPAAWSNDEERMPHVIHRFAMRREGRFMVVLAGALCALAFAAQPSHAGVLVNSAPSCAAQSTSRPFLPWLDIASYVPAPDGGFEAGAQGWSLDGAAPVAGNEPFKVGGSADDTALRIPAGGAATSPTFCVGLEHPTTRLFAKRVGGSLLSTLRVDVQFEDALGIQHTLPTGLVVNGGTWAPSLPMLLVANLLPLLPGDHTPVRLKLVPQGAGSWLVDDVYVDPFKRG